MVFGLLTGGSIAGLSHITTELLRRELQRRQTEGVEKPECGSKGGKKHYNTGIHVFALVLILALSTAGACCFGGYCRLPN